MLFQRYKKIPRRVIQFCHDATALPDSLQRAIYNTKNSQRFYSYEFFDDSRTISFISKYYDKGVLDLYKNNIIAASRCDMARLLILYKIGGFYVDLSMEIKASLNPYREYDLVLLQRDDMAVKRNIIPENAHFTNSIIGVRAEHSYIGDCITLMCKRLKSRQFNFNVINATGPGVLNEVLKGYCDLNLARVPFSFARENIFNYVRVQKFSNTWTEQQKLGIFRD